MLIAESFYVLPVEESKNNESTRKKLLTLLKRGGPQTATQLADQLNITPVAVRQHIQGLCEEGMLEFTEKKQPVGRPARCWRLSKAARSLFPDSHSKLTLDILDAVNNAFGADGVKRVLKERGQKQLQRYKARIPNGNAPAKERIAALATLRNEEGYMVEFVTKAEDRWLLIENNCPICSAAEECDYFCATEPGFFAAVLGEDLSVQRIEHSQNGSHHCVYEIQPKKS